MLKIRIEGMQDEINRFMNNFNDYYRVLSQSKPYKNRNSEYVRVYIEIGEDSGEGKDKKKPTLYI